jgi:hypothetical protein
MGSEALFKKIVAAIGFALQLLHGGVQILDEGFPFRLSMDQDGASFRIDPQRRPAARARDFNERLSRASHTGMVTQNAIL